VLVAGIARMRPSAGEEEHGRVTGFSVIDPGGNWIRISALARPDAAAELAATLG
jgi:hypothetical protein